MSPPDSTDRAWVAERVRIAAPRSRLEALLNYVPESTSADRILVLPPHPNFAGTMDNNVVRVLAESLTDSGHAVLRFNYPGIGESTLDLPPDGSVFDYWDDVENAQNFAAATRPAGAAARYLLGAFGPRPGRLHLVGYSFGAVIAMLLAEQFSEVASVTAVVIPWTARYTYQFWPRRPCPKSFIMAAADFACDPTVFEREWPDVPEPKHRIRLPHDHFFRGQESVVAATVSQCIDAMSAPTAAASEKGSRDV